MISTPVEPAERAKPTVKGQIRLSLVDISRSELTPNLFLRYNVLVPEQETGRVGSRTRRGSPFTGPMLPRRSGNRNGGEGYCRTGPSSLGPPANVLESDKTLCGVAIPVLACARLLINPPGELVGVRRIEGH